MIYPAVYALLASVCSPCTGDKTSFPWLILVCVLSLAAVIALFIIGRKRK